jgi:hypothetical protein
MYTHYLVIAELQFEALILDIIVNFVDGVGRLALLVGPIAINQHLVARVEEDTCMSYEEEDTCMLCACYLRRRIHACHMRMRIHACDMRHLVHVALASLGNVHDSPELDVAVRAVCVCVCVCVCTNTYTHTYIHTCNNILYTHTHTHTHAHTHTQTHTHTPANTNDLVHHELVSPVNAILNPLLPIEGDRQARLRHNFRTRLRL